VSPEASGIRVLIADDHAVVREGIRSMLAGDERFRIVGEAQDGELAVAMTSSLRPDVVVLDISMPHLSGLDAAARIRDIAPEVKVLILSIHDHHEYVLRSVRAGARGYLRKDSTPAQLRDAIRTLYEGGTSFTSPAPSALAPRLESERSGDARLEKLALLTAREREVLVAIARGATNKDIAVACGISVRTVESHREALMRKLDVKGAAALTRFALTAGIAE